MIEIENVLATGKTHTTLSPNDGRLDVKLSSPGTEGNPYHFEAIQQLHPTAEQFFAGVWSGCYTTVLQGIAKAKKMTLPADLSVDVEVDIGTTGGAYLLQARFTVRMPGVPQEIAEALAHVAHDHCPYSKATQGNIVRTMTVIAG